MRTTFAAALLGLAACGADIQVDSVCTTSSGYTLRSAPMPVASAPLPPIQLTLSLAAAVPTSGGVHDVHILARSFELTSTQSVAFVTTLTVSVVPPPGSGLPKRTLATYSRPSGFTGTSVELPGDGSDVYPYLAGGRLTLEVAGEADLRQAPTGSFTATTQMCAEVKGSVDYLMARRP